METAAKPKSYKDLLVWQKGLSLVTMVYELTKQFPPDERFGLVSQMRRAAVSVPSNIAEGQARRTTGEFVQFISHAEGSLAELETQTLISVDLRFTSLEHAQSILLPIEELQRMLNRLRQKLATPLATRH
jgi:four helix bundle protein